MKCIRARVSIIADWVSMFKIERKVVVFRIFTSLVPQLKLVSFSIKFLCLIEFHCTRICETAFISVKDME